MRYHQIVFVVFLTASCMEAPSPRVGRIVDLTHAFDSLSVYWPTEKGFLFEKGPAGMTAGGYFYSANRFWTPEHGGTHIDAPYHFYDGRDRVDEIPLEKLVGRGIVLDVKSKCSADRDYLVTKGDFEDWERRHGRIADGSIILINTGFARYWPDRVAYMGTDERGADAVSKLHFPGLHPDAAAWLATERRIKSVGLDTPSIDFGQSKDFPTHVALFEMNIPAFENVANLDELPATAFTVIALPMKIRGGSGGPLRIVAMLDSE